jgi:hypothetical protein
MMNFLKCLPLSLIALLVLGSGPALAKLSEAQCKADYNALVSEAAENRQHSLDELDRLLRYTTDDTAADSINQMINEAWEVEESFLSIAANVFRDCVNYARSPGS